MNGDSSLIRKIVEFFWIAALIFLYFDLRGVLFSKPVKGFYCDDIYIQKPFRGDTISFRTLIIVSLTSTVILILIKELLSSSKHGGKSFIWRFKNYYKTYSLGLTYVGAITNILKFFVRELRPHFIDSCRPDWSNINCSQGLVTKYNCTGNGPKWLVDKDIYQSFPSGHASVSFYTFVFVFLYTRSKVREESSQMSYLSNVVQIFFFSWAITCCVTRVTDFRHHWWDVVLGALLGVIGAILTVKYGSINYLATTDKDHQR
ncbi:phospholipid phosphatase 1-like [Centruroides vittatus]|uniref:phospholipid phosphatase 1-like n=1 Tax=Centruroides vittatus TaxID=120091 RepID=UPI00350EDFF6